MNKFNVDDIIICINNTSWENVLTYGKSYKVIKYDNGRISPITIIDDLGHLFRFNDNRFVLLDEWRQNKLNDLRI